MFADAEDVEADAIGELDLFQKMVHALNGAERQSRGRVGHGCCEAVDADLHLYDSFMWAPPGLFSAAAESVVNRTNRSTPGILANRGNQAANFERNGRRHAVHCVTLPERFARMLLLLHRALNNDSGEVLLVSDRQNRPKDDHDNRQGKPGWRHESVEEKDVHD